MVSVAEEYPARTDDNGTTWYRPVRPKGIGIDQWGWTSQPEQAHPDYAKAASLCGVPDNATPEDRAAILEFAAELQAKTAKVKSELYGNGPLDVPDIELPGMWERADFTGGRVVVRGANYDPNCQECNYDTHRCRGCGEPYLHGNHPSCKDCEPAENPAAGTQEKGITSEIPSGTPGPARYTDDKGSSEGHFSAGGTEPEKASPDARGDGPLDGAGQEERIRPDSTEPLLPRCGGRSEHVHREPQPPGAHQRGGSMTEMMVDGSPDVARYSEHSRYPLPPIPPQVEVTVDGYQRYKVPSPTTGKLTGFTRATTVARTTAEEYNLEQWKIRTKVMAVLKAKEAYEVVDVIAQGDEDTVELAQLYEKLLKAIAEGKSRPINQAIDKIDDVAGGADARELGGAVHDWLGELDSGRILLHQIPEQFQPYAVAYQECLMRAGLIAMPEYIERLVLNNRGIETICGRIDRIYRCVTDGQLYLGDLKTSESLDFSLLEYAIQFAAYGYAPLMCAMDRLSWEPMPKLVGLPHPSDNEVFGEDGDPRDPMCFCVHVPRTQPERSQVIPFNLRFGADAYIQALEVRKTRTAAKKEVLGQTTPIPSKEALRYVEARQALQNIHDEADARNVMEKYEDVLDDGLMEFGAQCFELL
ncbi:PD-(D/E)XK nuclease family protein [Mycobacteroides abscessus]|uniref:PD-(D/E)XK nuclease family protein n=1 Tax=Mycobacteroides abscessus TaxID=36809 RepID=UPI001F45CB8E|nr:PD-(D/E)XK nuclease family protein [Mycobacteroides abscessus]